jgi:hypothetical protein
MKRILPIIALLLLAVSTLPAQSSLFLRNNSWLDFDISLYQKGSYTTSPTNWNQTAVVLENWIDDIEALTLARDSTVLPIGDSVIFAIALSHGIDTVWIDFRLLRNGGTTDFATCMHGNGFNTGYNADGNFYEQQTTIAGRDLTIKYKADNDDSQQSRDIRLAIHENKIYEIDPADFANPNVLNLMAYNIQMLPLGVVGLPQAAERADLLPAQFSPYQDVVIFEEAFDILPRLLNLEPAMAAAGFTHNSGILNDYLPFNGGVIIFSRWPIEATADYDFELCGPTSQDCLANKGIKYARINKLGKYYNVFGTHFDAGSDSADLEAKNLQYTEMKNFIAAQNIPSSEAVIWGGDLNTDATNSHNLYYNMLDSIDIVVPNYSGFDESNFSRDAGDVIDHVFSDPRYLLPLEADLYITTFRSLDPVLWDVSNFSDHRSAISRFRFPDLSVSPGDQDLCPGEPLAFQSTSDIPVSRFWFHDGNVIGGVTGPNIGIASSTMPDSGLYELLMTYQHTYGTGTGLIDQLMYPNGSVFRTAMPILRAGYVTVSLANCPIAASEGLDLAFELFPNPTGGHLQMRRSSSSPIVWGLADLCGRRLLQGEWKTTTGEIDLSSLSAGTYLLTAQGRNGQQMTQRVMLAR